MRTDSYKVQHTKIDYVCTIDNHYREYSINPHAYICSSNWGRITYHYRLYEHFDIDYILGGFGKKTTIALLTSNTVISSYREQVKAWIDNKQTPMAMPWFPHINKQAVLARKNVIDGIGLKQYLKHRDKKIISILTA